MGPGGICLADFGTIDALKLESVPQWRYGAN
jgi:hypothetical protein